MTGEGQGGVSCSGTVSRIICRNPGKLEETLVVFLKKVVP